MSSNSNQGPGAALGARQPSGLPWQVPCRRGGLGNRGGGHLRTRHILHPGRCTPAVEGSPGENAWLRCICQPGQKGCTPPQHWEMAERAFVQLGCMVSLALEDAQEQLSPSDQPHVRAGVRFPCKHPLLLLLDHMGSHKSCPFWGPALLSATILVPWVRSSCRMSGGA